MKFLLQGKVDIETETKFDNSFPTNQFLIEGYSKPFGRFHRKVDMRA